MTGTGGELERGAARAATREQASSGQAGRLRSLAVRVLLFALLYALAAFWLAWHVAIGEWHPVAPFVLPLLGTAVPAVVTRLWKVLRGEDDPVTKDRVRRAARTLVSPTVLTCAAVLVLGLGSIWSAVTVRAGGAGGPFRVRVVAAEEDADDTEEVAWRELERGGSLRIARLPTRPWGRRYALEVQGHERIAFRSWPWLGATMDASRARRIPSLRVRIGFSAHGSLTGGRLVLEIEGRPPVEVAMDGEHALAVFGPEVEVTPSDREGWREDLVTELGTDDPLVLRRFAQRWNDPLQVELDPPLAADARGTVRFLGQKDHVEASAEIRLDDSVVAASDGVVDLLLERSP